MYKHLFLLRVTQDIPPKITIDSYISERWNRVAALRVASKLRNENPPMSSLESAYFGMKVRSRYNLMHGPLLVNNEEQISRDMMQSVIDGMTPDKLKQFIEEAKC